MTTTQLRLILGDQLNAAHSWFSEVNPSVVYLIAELHQEQTYVTHHIQKIAAFFTAMQSFAEHLVSEGHRVIYLTLDDTAEFADLNALIHQHVSTLGCSSFSYQRPDEYRLREQLTRLATALPVPVQEVDTDHFLLPFDELKRYFNAGKHVRMETFYRKMRQRFAILMDGDQPLGGQWNFDVANRKSMKPADVAAIPQPLIFSTPIQPLLDRLKRHQISTIGKTSDHLPWPINREQSIELLKHFCTHLLPLFGTFQDAMTRNSPYAWSLYHSRLSFSLNCKLISPREVIDTALESYYQNPDVITLPQIEGFVRQILGWREYVRGMYWVNMPDYSKKNYLQAHRPLPDWFWTGETQMACMSAAITQSLDHAYAHHIQRLMITGNFALLAGLAPGEVDQWYLGIYLDAIEWVELPNTRGMALFADGGWIATKPYAASGNYVNKMSDYCSGCHYQVKEKTGALACPLNSLYWHFIDQHQDQFARNPRMSFPVKHWTKMDAEQQTAIRNHARTVLEDLASL